MTVSRREATAVLDVGKTNVRLCAVDDDGRALRTLEHSNEVVTGPPYPHFDTDNLFAWIVDQLSMLNRDFDLSAIVPVAHGASAALVDERGLVLPILDYEFEGPGEIDGEYDGLAGDFEHTFSPKLPAGLNLGRQLYWQQARFPQAFRAATILPYPQYWAFRMSGVRAWEPTSLGCHTDLWEPQTSNFSKFAKMMGWSAQFAKRVNAWTSLGPVASDLATATGLSQSCVVLAGIHDSNASYFAYRAMREDRFSVVSTGTWVIAMARGGSLEGLREDRDTLANVDAFGEPVPTGRFMGGREYAAICGDDGLRAEPGIGDLIGVLGRGTLALPAFSDRGGPFRECAGRIVGPPPEDPHARAAVAALYCALMTDLCLDFLNSRGEIIVEGRLSGNEAYTSALAGLRAPQPVLRSADRTGTLRGAAILKMRARSEQPRPLTLTPCHARGIAGLDTARARWSKMLPKSQRPSPQ